MIILRHFGWTSTLHQPHLHMGLAARLILPSTSMTVLSRTLRRQCFSIPILLKKCVKAQHLHIRLAASLISTSTSTIGLLRTSKKQCVLTLDSLKKCAKARHLHIRLAASFILISTSTTRPSQTLKKRCVSTLIFLKKMRQSIAATLSRRGQSYESNGNYDRAITDYSEAIRLNPAPVFFTRRGYVYHAKGEYDRAIADYNEAIRINPEYVNAYTDRGFAHFTKGDYDRAIVEYTEAIRLDQRHAISYRNRAIAYLYAGFYGKAQSDLKAAIQLMPKDAYIAVWQEIVARHANTSSTLERAVPSIDMAVWPGPIIRFLMGESTHAGLLAAAKETDPKKRRERLCEVNFFVGQFALQRGTKDEAERAFDTAARDCPRQFIELAAANAELRALHSKQ
jgi:lipoprotein NlpI